MPPADFKPAKQVLRGFLNAAGRVGLGSVFFPFLWLGEGRGSVWATVLTGVQFPFQALRAVSSPHCPLRLCARPVPTIHLIVQPLD